MSNYLQTGLFQYWINHYSHGQKTFQMCIIRGEKVVAAGRDASYQIHTSSRKVQSDQAQKEKISLHPYRSEVSKILVSSG